MYIQLGMAERAPVGTLCNSVALIGPEGVVGVFRKVHMQDEKILFNVGNSIPVWKTTLGILGPIICYDLCFPEIVRVHALHGVDIVTFSTAWAKSRDSQNNYCGYVYDLLGKANAMVNQVWLIQSNAVGIPIPEGRSDDDYYGHSRIISPLGQVVEEIRSEEGLVTALINVKEGILEARTQSGGGFGLNFIQDRRPELYGEIVNTRLYEPPIS
jgi:predicted amidohydrolase